MQDCLQWGSRVVIPGPLRPHVLKALHEEHSGIVHIKALGRSYVWLPNLDRAITEWDSRCGKCQENRPALPVAHPQECKKPKTPWSRIHIDFAGPIQGQMLLVVVNAHSKWAKIVTMASTTIDPLIRALSSLLPPTGYQIWWYPIMGPD